VAKLNIPDRNREGLSTLLAMDPETFDHLVIGLRAQPTGWKLVTRLQRDINLPNVDQGVAEKVVPSVISLHIVRANREASLDEFVDDVSEAIGTFDPVGRSKESKQRLRTILDIQSLYVSAKAYIVLADHQRTARGIKILTDVRYVFQANPEEEPFGAVIVHTLKLSYHENEDHKEFYIALDDDDLARLRGVLDRADAKANILARKLNDAKVPYLGNGIRFSEGGR
jgi:hypothetical protein